MFRGLHGVPFRKSWIRRWLSDWLCVHVGTCIDNDLCEPPQKEYVTMVYFTLGPLYMLVDIENHSWSERVGLHSIRDAPRPPPTKLNYIYSRLNVGFAMQSY
jgi:hypothetical protein